MTMMPANVHIWRRCFSREPPWTNFSLKPIITQWVTVVHTITVCTSTWWFKADSEGRRGGVTRKDIKTRINRWWPLSIPWVLSNWAFEKDRKHHMVARARMSNQAEGCQVIPQRDRDNKKWGLGQKAAIVDPWGGKKRKTCLLCSSPTLCVPLPQTHHATDINIKKPVTYQCRRKAAVFHWLVSHYTRGQTYRSFLKKMGGTAEG